MAYRPYSTGSRTRFLEYVAAIFARPSAAEIVEHLRELTPLTPYRVRMKVLYSDAGVLTEFDDLARIGSVSRLDERGPGFALQVGHGEGASLIHFAVLPTPQPHVAVVVSVAEREEWHLLLRLIRRAYPALVPIYLSQRELLHGRRLLLQRGEGRE